ncbi:Velvet domain-containing protein [Mycena chlorophos]|uniref:Velvet domain-containing protein n=1 Tax=Mycena chlorophos TaxID=658473 RepID=A0A8H6WKS3_MYCCL|nr:Velvet domain-containing protein [Mycena chlorophos]
MYPGMDPWSSMARQQSAQPQAGPSQRPLYNNPDANPAPGPAWYPSYHAQAPQPASGSASGPRSGAGPAVDSTTTSFIGRPVRFTEGRFAGETIFAELKEIQCPEYGRRFGSVDRRVLDDPPVVELRLYHVHNVGVPNGQYSVEVDDYENVALAGLLCMVDLFEIVSPRTDDTDAVLAVVDGHRITEAAKRTQYLFGTTFVEAYLVKIPDKEKKRLLFTFSVSELFRRVAWLGPVARMAYAVTSLKDLAVRLEGQFLLRYRFFDVLSRPAGHAYPTVLAEHFGGVFTVYSTKSAPALKESTELTKALGRHSVPVNIRKKQRAPRRKVHSASPSFSDDSMGTS